MSKLKKGYHITPKSNLYSIQKYGLLPRIGRRSYSVNEYEKAVSFTDNLASILVWKERFFGDTSLDDFAILTFELDDDQWNKKFGYASVGDLYTVEAIPPENIRVIQIIKKGMPQQVVSLEALREVTDNNSEYQIAEQQIIELFFEEPLIDDEMKRDVIEKLADYEHKKWSEDYAKIEWKAKKNKDGSLEISDEDVREIQKYINLDYEQSEDFYKKDINKSVMESFFIMQENDMISYLGMSDEEVITILERVEYIRKNRRNEYLLSVCARVNGKYIIPAEKVELWGMEMRTPYTLLSEKEKQADRREVNNILLAIEQCILNKEKTAQVPKKKAEKKDTESQDIGE